MKKRISILLVALFIFANMAILSYAQEANTTATTPGTDTKGAQGPGGTASETAKPKEHKKSKGLHKKGMHRKGNTKSRQQY